MCIEDTLKKRHCKLTPSAQQTGETKHGTLNILAKHTDAPSKSPQQ